MTGKCRLGWGLAALFLITTLALAYTFLVQGKTRPSADGRTAILLTSAERDLVLAEMRAFLAAAQGVVEGGTRSDPAAVARAARGVGAVAQQGVPASLMGKLPLAFKSLGLDTHRQFDQLALNAEQMGDAQQAQIDLARLMSNCVACHAAYRIEAEQP